ncbi:DNA ligase 1-like [Cataglyphis hispanica]|uniref:DNA ligase 1-like n=1 Tax=Cataglyphis hispanica TaxID=1086592 RepID=UPI00217F5232|nr:DNA ligase 1-like [Cataglyphis hispanica]
MKIKVDKKGKKRSLSEISLSTKPEQKQENITELKKSPKKAKLALVQNGNSTMGNKVQILKKMYKQKEKQKAKKSINIGPLAKIKGEGENKLPTTKLNEESATKKIKEKTPQFENLKKKQAKRLQKKKRNNAFRKCASITLSIEQIEAKIEEIRNREVLSKQAKKNLKVLNRKLKFEKLANKSEKLNIIEKKNNKKNKQQIGAIKKVSNEDNKDKIKVKKEHVQHEKIKIKREMDDQDDEDENDEDQSNSEKEEPMDIANEQFDDESDEDEEDEDAEDDTDEKANILKGKKEDVKKMKKQVKDQKNQHFLYVYNLPLDVTEDELKQHFLTKVDTVSRVVINKSNIKKPPIVAYVWMTNSTDCKKGLSLHHTFLKNKRIIVKMKSNDNKNVGKDFGIHLPTSQHAIAKNKKPQAFQKAKKLASGNQGQKKSLKKEK